MIVRVIEDFYLVVKYLKLVEPANTKANGILVSINGAFADFGFSAKEYKQKLIGFGSDGASVMMGARRGVIELLKKLQRLQRSCRSIFISMKKQTELGGWITSYDLQPS